MVCIVYNFLTVVVLIMVHSGTSLLGRQGPKASMNRCSLSMDVFQSSYESLVSLSWS